MNNNLFFDIRRLVINSFFSSVKTWLKLLKIIIPITFLMKVLIDLGMVEPLSKFIEPIMELVGLPGLTAVVWVTAILTNIWGGLLILASINDLINLSVAQATTLGIVLLITHALPMELSIVRRCGVNPFFALALRFFSSVLFGLIYYHTFTFFNILNEPANILINETSNLDLYSFVVNEAFNYLLILAILFAVILIIDVTEYYRIIRIFDFIMQPILKVYGISSAAAPITLVGIMLGLNYGGGLLIKYIDEGKLDDDDRICSIMAMNLNHSVIIDAFIVVLAGANVLWVLPVRFILSSLIAMIFSIYYKKYKLRMFPLVTYTA